MSTRNAVHRVLVGLLVLAGLAVPVGLVATPAVAAPCTGTSDFPDVPKSSPFCTDIAWLVDEGITTGYGDGTFRPGTVVTRQAMAAFLARLAGVADTLPACTTQAFTDVPASHLFCKEIVWLAGEGITTGYTDGSFKPTATVTRQAMAAFMARFKSASPPACAFSSFSDVDVDHTFCPEIGWLDDEGVTTGYTDGSFRPSDPVTRQAMAAFMNRLQNGPPPDTCAASTIPGTECAALLAFYQATGQRLWVNHTGWGTATDPCTSWFGITCESGHVIAIDLPANGLSGAVPAQITGLTGLWGLGLDQNDLTSIPAAINQFDGLGVLWLYGNELTSLPATLGQVTTLESIDVAYNDLSALPANITGLTALLEAYFEGNHLSSLPVLSGYADLQVLWANLNQIGSLPPSVGSLPNLWSLNVGDNQLTSVPAQIGNLGQLEELGLYRNRLTGNITSWAQPLSQNSAIVQGPGYLVIGDRAGGNNCLTVTNPAVATWLDQRDELWSECDSARIPAPAAAAERPSPSTSTPATTAVDDDRFTPKRTLRALVAGAGFEPA